METQLLQVSILSSLGMEHGSQRMISKIALNSKRLLLTIFSEMLVEWHCCKSKFQEYESGQV